jgi:drug/metabolite transporter (DMT)-like permease
MTLRGWVAAVVVLAAFAGLAVLVHRAGHLNGQVGAFLLAAAIMGAAITGLVVSGLRSKRV